jgi:hypothetical protein
MTLALWLVAQPPLPALAFSKRLSPHPPLS